MNKKVLWICETALFIALLIVVQLLTRGVAGAPGQILTGSLVNLILITSTITIGLVSGIVVALVSPFFAFVLGVGTPMLPLVPAIALGNLVLVLVWGLVNKKTCKVTAKSFISWIGGAVAKFVFMFLVIVKFMLPTVLKLEGATLTTMSMAMGVLQLITATIGGLVAVAIMPVLNKAIKTK